MPVLWSLCSSPSGKYACEVLRKKGWDIQEKRAAEAQRILLDIPSKPLDAFDQLPRGTIVYGGKLSGLLPDGVDTIDLLQDPEFTARNADITARCALRLLCSQLESTLLGLPVLVIGWGRIGKCLAKYLNSLGANCMVYARKPEDQALLKALGYRSLCREEMLDALPSCRAVLNTAPAAVLSLADTQSCGNCLLLDLASSPGIPDPRALSARGLPGKMAPLAAGTLIAQTLCRLWKEDIR